MNHRPSATDKSLIKDRKRKAWASGDYAVFGTVLNVISELLCEAADLRPGEQVLDVAQMIVV
ncbi:MAG: hypothetical protein WA990_03480 [Rubrobacteraceae bacterium]